MDLKIILLTGFILTVGGNNSRNEQSYEDSEEEEKQLAGWSSKENEDEKQQNIVKDTVKINENTVDEKSNKNKNLIKAEDAVQNEENITQKSPKNTTGNDENNKNQPLSIDKNIDENKLKDPGEGQNKDSKDQEIANNKNNENNEKQIPINPIINIENKDQEQPKNMSYEQNNVNIEKGQSTDTSNNHNIENKDQLKPMNMSNEQNNENEEREKPNNQNFENKDQEPPTQKPNNQNIENKDQLKHMNMNRQNNTVLQEEKPNIVVIMADDLGWNDFSYHGSDQILTPNIDVIAYQGVVIQQHYTDAYGTASRSAFFTGKYPFRLGTQSESILASEDRGLPIDEILLPSYLKDLGYTTHLIGKWGLGKSREHFLPTNRGFDTFFGFLDSAVDYYTYNHVESWNNTQYFGLDLYNNRIPAEHIKGHLTEVLTDHAVQLIREHPVSYPMYLQVSHAAPHAGGGLVNLQPPVDEIAKNNHIAHTARRLYAAMVTSLDNSVGQIITALAEKQILNNTIIVFLTDNGAAQNYGSNLPLRGIKGTPWEGGVRSSAVVWHHKVESNIWDGLFHITDWLPTLLTAAGGNITTALDGVNQWQAVNDNGFSKRNDVLIAVDDLNGWAAMIEGDYKIIVGNAITDEFSGYGGKDMIGFKYDPPFYSNVLLNCEAAKAMGDLGRELDLESVFLKRNETLLIEIGNVDLRELCVPTEAKGCLFNIKEDPLEAHDVWATSPDIVKRLTLRLRTIWAELKPRAKPVRDDRCNPTRSNYVWTQWLDNDEPHPASLLFPATFPLQASKDELQYLVDINMNSFRDKIFEYVQGMGDSFVKSVSGLFNF